MGGRPTGRFSRWAMFLKNLIGGEPDRVFVPLGLQELVDLRVCEGGIGAKEAAHLTVPITRDYRFHNIPPAVGRVNVAGTQSAAFQIAELVEDEQRMVAGAAEVAVVGRVLLIAESRADAGIHVQHDSSHRAALGNTVDPHARQRGQCPEIVRLRHHLCLEAAHLTGRSRLRHHSASADDETHRRIASKPVGVVDIFVSGQASEYRLTKLRDQPVTAVPAGSRVGKNTAGHLR